MHARQWRDSAPNDRETTVFLRAAPDHHGVGAGRRKRRIGIVKIFDVAVDDDRDRDCILDRADRRPIGAALVELAAGAAMHRNEPHAGCLRAPRQFGRVTQSIIPAEPHLESDRHPHRADHRLDQAERMIEIAHQRRAGLAAGDVARRTTHVDVDDGRAEVFGNARALLHPAGLATGDLHHMQSGTVILNPPPRHARLR